MNEREKREFSPISFSPRSVLFISEAEKIAYCSSQTHTHIYFYMMNITTITTTNIMFFD